jgi:hypothetical protein
MTEKKNICFVSNFYKTPLYEAIAKKLVNDQGYNIFFIAANQHEVDVLKKNWKAECILDATIKNIEKFPPSDSFLKHNEIVLRDRVMRHNMSGGIDYLTRLASAVEIFIDENSISHIFGEITWAHEILISRAARARKPSISYSIPHTIRIPNNRFSFFIDENQSEISSVELSQIDNNESIEFCAPSYLAINNKITQRERKIGSRVSKIRRFITGENRRNNDPTSFFMSTRANFLVKVSIEVNRELLRFSNFTKEIPTEPFVFMTLHKQPEASIDVCGRYYEDQEANIINTWRCLPAGWKLVVKEHSNALGDRGPLFFRRLAKLPGLTFADPHTSSWDFIKSCECVITVTGTAAYEAALMQKPALTLAPCFFNRFPSCRRISLDDLKNCSSILDLMPGKNALGQSDASRYILTHSAAGNISDVVSDPSVISEHNIASLAEGFTTYLAIV